MESWAGAFSYARGTPVALSPRRMPSQRQAVACGGPSGSNVSDERGTPAGAVGLVGALCECIRVNRVCFIHVCTSDGGELFGCMHTNTGPVPHTRSAIEVHMFSFIPPISRASER